MLLDKSEIKGKNCQQLRIGVKILEKLETVKLDHTDQEITFIYPDNSVNFSTKIFY